MKNGFTQNIQHYLQLRGERPFLSEKYDVTKHPNYNYLSDYDPSQAYNIEKQLNTKLKPNNNLKTNLYELGNVEDK